MKTFASLLCATAIALFTLMVAAPANAQPAPDCGGYGGRACPAGMSPGGQALGQPTQAVGAMGMTQQQGPGAADPAAGTGGFGATAPAPDNGFSWRQRGNDGNSQTCRRRLDNTIQCDPDPAANQDANQANGLGYGQAGGQGYGQGAGQGYGQGNYPGNYRNR